MAGIVVLAAIARVSIGVLRRPLKAERQLSPRRALILQIMELAAMFFLCVLVGAVLVNTLIASYLTAFDLTFHDPVWAPGWLCSSAGYLFWLAYLFTFSLHFLVAFDRTAIHALGRLWSMASTVLELIRTRDSYPQLEGCELPADDVASDGPAILMVSDTHVTAPGVPSLEGSELDEGEMFAVIASWVDRVQPSVIVHGGDVTDRGTDDEFASARAWLGLVNGASIPWLFVPGNHDVHYRFASDPLLPSPGSHSPARTSAMLDSLSPGLAAPGVAASGGFPRLVPLGTDAGALRFLLLDSCRRHSSSWITNAIGLVGPVQREAARAMIKADVRSDAPLVIVLHHHVGFLADTLHTRGEYDDSPGVSDLALLCSDAALVLDLAHDVGAIAIMHGHRHMPCTARHTRDGHTVTIVSCGSARYVAKGPFEHVPGLDRVSVQGPSAMVLRVDPRTRHVTVGLLRWPGAVELATRISDPHDEHPATEVLPTPHPPQVLVTASTGDGAAELRGHRERSALFMRSLWVELFVVIAYFVCGLFAITPPTTEQLGSEPPESSPIAEHSNDVVARSARLVEVERYLNPLCQSNIQIALREELAKLRAACVDRSCPTDMFDSWLESLAMPPELPLTLAWRMCRLVDGDRGRLCREEVRDRSRSLPWSSTEDALRRFFDGAPDPACTLQGDPLHDPPLPPGDTPRASAQSYDPPPPVRSYRARSQRVPAPTGSAR